MRVPNGFFGNGPSRDDVNTRDQEAYLQNKLQMTVAGSTFAGVALVGMFCSCLWFACCRNSSSKTRKKARTWATANPEAGLQNPYTYDGYMDGEGYMQMQNNNDGTGPYMYGENGLPNAYNFDDHFGFNHGNKAQMNTQFGGAPVQHGSDGTTPKDVPPSYTALFFAASDGSSGMGGSPGEKQSCPSANPKVTSIQPIHLKVTSNVAQENGQVVQVDKPTQQTKNSEDEMNDNYVDIHERERAAGPVSLMSVESDPGNKSPVEQKKMDRDDLTDKSIAEEDHIHPPAYNPGYKGYMKF